MKLIYRSEPVPFVFLQISEPVPFFLQIGAGAFGVVHRAVAVGIREGEDQVVETLDCCDDDGDDMDSFRRWLQSSL